MPKEVRQIFEATEEVEGRNLEVTRTYSLTFDDAEPRLTRQDVYSFILDEESDRQGGSEVADRCSLSIQDLQTLSNAEKSFGSNIRSLLDQSNDFSQDEWDSWFKLLAPLACKGELYSYVSGNGLYLQSWTGTWENFDGYSSKYLAFDGINFELETENRTVNYTLDEFEFDCAKVSLATFEELSDQLQITEARLIFRTIGDAWTWHVIDELFSAKGVRD
jgi:hypothetical protein